MRCEDSNLGPGTCLLLFCLIADEAKTETDVGVLVGGRWELILR